MNLRITVLAALACLAMPAVAHGGAAPVVVTGPAGSMASVTFDEPAVFEEGTVTTTSDRGGWGGVVAIEDNGQEVRSFLNDVTLTESFRCPDASCPYTGGDPLFGGRGDELDDRVVFEPGRYHVVLAGPDGAQVTAKLDPIGAAGAPRAVTATDRPVSYVVSVTDGTGPPGRQTALHAFDTTPGNGKWGSSMRYTPHAILTAGAMAWSECWAVGTTISSEVVRPVGGIAPCQVAYTRATDEPSAGLAMENSPVGAFGPIDAAGFHLFGPNKAGGWPHGLGVDWGVAGVSTYLQSVYVGVDVN
jgi:hypothetical protein